MDDAFPAGFFDRADETDDGLFYQPVRLVEHIDDQAIAAIGALYSELDINGCVLDLMGSWISHFATPPDELVVLGMNATELDSNAIASSVLTHDLNREPQLPFDDGSFDDVVCAVSVDYLTRPIEVFAEVRRVLRPGGRLVCTFSNRCFPTKAIRGWLMANESDRPEIVSRYFDIAGGFTGPTIRLCNEGAAGDPLYAVWASTLAASEATP